MAKKEPITFSGKIDELNNYKNERMESLRQKLADAIRDGGDPEVLVKKYKKDVENLNNIDIKIRDLQAKRTAIREMPIYSETEKGQEEILKGNEVYEYLKNNNEEELLNALKTRTMTRGEFLKLYYPHFFGADTGDKSTLSKEVGKENEKIEPKKKKKVKIEKPSKTLSDLSVKYKKLDSVILPTKEGTSPKGMGGKNKTDNSEKVIDYQNKIKILFSKILTIENGFTSNDFNVIVGPEPENMVRKTTYIVVEIPGKNKTIILNNGYGEASFLCDEIFDENLLTNTTKEELSRQYRGKIRKLKFEDEELWINKILMWLGKIGDTKLERVADGEDLVEVAEEEINKPKEKNADKNIIPYSEVKETAERRKATPKELFDSFEQYLKFFLDTDNLKNIPIEKIRELVNLLKIQENYEEFCKVSKMDYLNDSECEFPNTLKLFMSRISPIKINEEQFISILQSNYSLGRDAHKIGKIFAFYPYWLLDAIHEEDLITPASINLKDLYGKKSTLLNQYGYSVYPKDVKKTLGDYDVKIRELEREIISTKYPHLKEAYRALYEDRENCRYKDI